MWRLLENPMHDRSHAVYRLAIHLPNEQMVYFQHGQEEAAAERAQQRDTHLTAWFKLNESDLNARQYLYCEIPIHYVFDRRLCKWKTRQKGEQKVIVRMYAVSPKDQERFYLRLLLQHIRGAQSFNEIKTVNSVISETFKEAAIKLNILEDDSEWEKCLDEASQVCIPSQLRFTFALICVFNSPRDPSMLFEKFQEPLTAVYIKYMNAFTAVKKALQDI